MAGKGAKEASVTETQRPQVRGLTAVPRFFKVSQVAARLGVMPKTVRRWVEAGEFPGTIQPDGLLLVPEADVLAFIERSRRAQKGAEVP